MFDKLKRQWRNARGPGLRRDMEDAVLRLNAAGPEVNARAALSLQNAYRDLESRYGSLANVSNDGKLKLAKELRQAGRRQFDLDMGGAYGIGLLSMWLESQAISGPDATFVFNTANGFLQAALNVRVNSDNDQAPPVATWVSLASIFHDRAITAVPTGDQGQRESEVIALASWIGEQAVARSGRPSKPLDQDDYSVAMLITFVTSNLLSERAEVSFEVSSILACMKLKSALGGNFEPEDAGRIIETYNAMCVDPLHQNKLEAIGSQVQRFLVTNGDQPLDALAQLYSTIRDHIVPSPAQATPQPPNRRGDRPTPVPERDPPLIADLESYALAIDQLERELATHSPSEEEYRTLSRELDRRRSAVPPGQKQALVDCLRKLSESPLRHRPFYRG